MRNWRHLLLVLLVFLPGPAGAATGELAIGLLPNLSTRLLLGTFKPMREFLENKLGRPVTLYTSPDLSNFVSRTQNREYDLIVTAPHFARLAQTDAGYQPLLSFRSNIFAVVVVAKNSRFTSLDMLSGETIAAPDRLALVTMAGLKMLHGKGLEPGGDYDLLWTRTHGNVALAVQRGEAAAGIMGILPLKQLPDSISRQLRVLSTTPAVNSQVIMANQHLTADQQQQIKEALLQFEQSPEGQQFFRSTHLDGFKPLGTNDLLQLDPYAKEVRRMMEPPK